MESSNSSISTINKNCSHCTEEPNCLVSDCSQCNISLCSDCHLIHQEKHKRERIQIQDLYNELRKKINEKETYINNTSQESIEIVVNWYQRLINDLIESQTQVIENIQHERDRARDELVQFDLNMHTIEKDIPNINSDSIRTKLNDLSVKLSNYQITKDICLPDSRTYQPRYKIYYESKNSSELEEDWDIKTNEGTNIPLPSHLSLSSSHIKTAPVFYSDTSQAFVTPKDDDDDDENDFQWREELEENNTNDTDYLLDPKSYQLGTSRHLNSTIDLIASNGNDLLCYSRQSKQLIFIGDGNVHPIILQWYHGHMIQLVWFDNLQSFVTLTDDHQYVIYTIVPINNQRLKIRLATGLPKPDYNIRKDEIYLRCDESHIFIYYERIDGRKRLRLLSPTFECVRSYPIDKCFQRDEHIRSYDNGFVVGLGVNQDHVVLFVRSAINTDLADQAASQTTDTRLLVFNKSTMCFIRRIILSNNYFELPFIVHFINLSSFFIIDQTYHILRFFNLEKEIGQIKLLPSNTSPILHSTTLSKSNIDIQYSSIVLMNDGSLLLSNNTKDLIQLILNDQINDIDDW